jgi:hypothetical protein
MQNVIMYVLMPLNTTEEDVVVIKSYSYNSKGYFHELRGVLLINNLAHCSAQLSIFIRGFSFEE